MTDIPPPQRPPRNHCRIFNESAQYGGQVTLRDTGLVVADLLQALDRDGDAAVLARHQGVLTPRDIAVCRTIAAHHMPDRPEYRRNGADSPVRILLDENMPHAMIPRLFNDDSRLIHISFNRLTTMADPIIWRFAKDKAFNAILTSDNDFIKMAEMEILERLQKSGSFDRVPIADLPLVVYMPYTLRDSHLADDDRMRKVIGDITTLCAQDGRQSSYAAIDADGLRAGPDVRAIYHRHMRSSLEHMAMDKPVFDKSVMDYRAINSLREKCGMRLLRFSGKVSWKNFYEQNFTPLKRQNGPFYRP